MEKTGNYSALYVKEPFTENDPSAKSAHDFCYYNALRMWKDENASFPFVDSHNNNYNVRDDSSWEIIQSRIEERLSESRNIILYLSSNTYESKALKEELEYGMNTLGLPVIVIYSFYGKNIDIVNGDDLKPKIKKLWDKVPTFKKYMHDVATMHVPMKRSFIVLALKDEAVMVNTMKKGTYFYKKAI